MKCQVWKNKNKNVRVKLLRQGRTRRLYGLFLANGKKEFTIDIDIVHEARDTESLVVLRGLVTENAAVNIRGNVFIKKGARGAKTRFEAKALLLSEQARCEIIPALEIDENEVQASHSTYVGKLDEEEMFYLQSRGISEERAKQMLIEAFLYPVTSRMQKSNIKNKNDKQELKNYSN